LVADLLEQQKRRPHTELFMRNLDRGQAGLEPVHEAHVIEAGKRDVGWASQSPLVECIETAERKHVIGRYHRGEGVGATG
jgi:hypothetical protein